MDILIIFILLALIYLIYNFNRPEGFSIGAIDCTLSKSIDPFRSCEDIDNTAECVSSMYYDIDGEKFKKCIYDNSCKKPTDDTSDCDINYCRGVEVNSSEYSHVTGIALADWTPQDDVQNTIAIKEGDILSIVSIVENPDWIYVVPENDEVGGYVPVGHVEVHTSVEQLCDYFNLEPTAPDYVKSFLKGHPPTGGSVNIDCDQRYVSNFNGHRPCEMRSGRCVVTTNECEPYLNNEIIRKVWQNLANSNITWWVGHLLTIMVASCAVMIGRNIYRDHRSAPWIAVLVSDSDDSDNSDNSDDSDYSDYSDNSDDEPLYHVDTSSDEENPMLTFRLSDDWEMRSNGRGSFTYVNGAGLIQQNLPSEFDAGDVEAARLTRTIVNDLSVEPNL